MRAKSSVKPVLTVLLVLTALLTTAGPTLADGIIIIDPPPWPEPPPLRDTWLTIRYHRVDVTIEDQVATTHIDQVFVNEHDWEAEGTYVFPLPQGAVVSRFTMWVDGQAVDAQVLDADQARAIYEDIVRRRRDPALLEYIGQGAVQASIFPIPPGGERRIEIEYSEVLPVDNGLVRYVYPLNTERFSARPLEEVTVSIDLRSADAMRAVYSPTHQDRALIERDGDYHASVSYEETNVTPDTDFELYYTVSQDEVGLNLLSFKEGDEDGFFLLLVAPSVEREGVQAIPKDVICVLDVSGSMEGEKIEQARDALVYVLEHLNPEDRFNVVAFSSGLQSYASGLRPASEAGEAAGWVERLQAMGGTDINRALLEALAQVDGERPAILIFLTDGQPTEGIVEIDSIIANVAASAPSNARLFPFGVGYDVNTLLLDTLAQDQRGVTAYVEPGERIDEQVSAFYAKVSTPVLADLALDFGSVDVYDVYPDPLPDLFAGTQLVLAGRYREGRATTIRLGGTVDGEERELIYEGTFQDGGTGGGDDFIPRLWATRKIGYLLTQIRLRGEQREWVDAIVDLSVRYGIITPYTSFLIQEGDFLTEEGRSRFSEWYYSDLQAAPAPSSGAGAVNESEDRARLSAAESGAAPLPAEAAQSVRRAGDKTFVLQDGVWTDTAFDPSQMETVQVGFGSDTYFDMLTARPQWGRYAALGQRVIFVAEGTAYEIVEGEGQPVEIPPAATSAPAPSSTPVAANPAAQPAGPSAGPSDPEPPAGSPVATCSGAALLLGLVGGALWLSRRR